MRIGLVLAAAALLGSAALAKPYTVQKGDTLYSIARKHNLPLARILMLNKLSGETIRPGQVLQLPDDTAGAAPAVRPPAPAASRPATGGAAVVRAAYGKVGSRYVWGGNGPTSFDCSGFVRFVYQQFGVDLPRTSAEQFRAGTPVPRSGLIEGDLLFFATRGGRISHIGIYIGNNRMVHASTPRTGVIMSSLGESYYAERFVGARRVLR